jgi:hypothetical protein
MVKPNKLEAGDRIAYAAKFLRNIADYSAASANRRGTFVSYDQRAPQFARVRWDDVDMAYLAAQWGDDYAEDVRDNGQMVLAVNIAKVGSPRFALNDI